mgnify:CR=1 FL=1
MMRYTIRYVSLLAGMLTAFSSCEHKDLCFDHEAHAPKSDVHVKAVYEKEWNIPAREGPTGSNTPHGRASSVWSTRFVPDAPDGLRVQVYNEDGTNNILNVAPEGDIVRMRTGEHSLLLYNNDTEYIVFNDIAALASASATTRSLTRGAFEALHAGERTVNQPDMLYGAYIGSYEALPTQETVGLPVRLQPLTYTYLVRYEFNRGFSTWPSHAEHWQAWPRASI